MRISDAFPSKYLKAADLKGRPRTVIVADCLHEEVDQGERKPVAYFQDMKKALILNLTNSRTIVDAFGDETDAWVGKQIELYPTKVSFQGRLVDAIRVRIPAPPPQAEADAFEDDIPW